jgi:hypothetical protein
LPPKAVRKGVANDDEVTRAQHSGHWVGLSEYQKRSEFCQEAREEEKVEEV